MGHNQIGFESGVSSFFSLVACLPFSPQKSSPCCRTIHAILTFLEWTKHLSPGDLLKTSWCSRQAEVLRKLFFPSPLLWYSIDSPDPLSSLSVLLVFLPQFRDSFSQPFLLLPVSLTSIQIYPSIFSLPNHRTFFWKLPTVILPYHCTYRPPTTTCASCWSLCVPVHLKLSSNQICTAQLKLRWGTPWEGGMTACISHFHVTAKIVPCPPRRLDLPLLMEWQSRSIRETPNQVLHFCIHPDPSQLQKTI